MSIFSVSEDTQSVLDLISKSFIPVYLFEILLKVIHYGFRTFFEDNWNTYGVCG